MAFNFSFWILRRLEYTIYYIFLLRQETIQTLSIGLPLRPAQPLSASLSPFRSRSWDQIVGIPIKPMWSRDSHLCIQKQLQNYHLVIQCSYRMILNHISGRSTLRTPCRCQYFLALVFLEFNNCVVKVLTPASPFRYFSLV